METLIRALKKEDVPAVAMLESACFSTPWPEEQIEYERSGNPCAKVLVAVSKDGDLQGYLDFMITFDSATINRICVAESERHQGIATALLNRMVEIAKAQKEKVEFITLEVRASNETAHRLYQKLGWQDVTRKPHYYDDGEDAIYMVRSIL
ncbi:MAG: ribosomal protein S18-alanine N-acetyltransferase [Erysipelotrichaceae bacterium]|nr:ribosomal protein S18-alanine N-acetyltransferase [Erysipelotrichaceae bacterium]